jgi:hypothetical protein
MKFNILTNMGRFSVYDPARKKFAVFVGGEFETDDIHWLNVLKNVEGVQVVDGADIPEESAPTPVLVKKGPGRPKKVNR